MSEPTIQSYEDSLLEGLDASDHEACSNVLFKFALILEIESSDEPPTEASMNRWMHRLDPADKSIERGMSIRTVTQNLAGACDLLSDTGKELSRFLRFSERLERLIREQKRKR